jgi:hypothetical protein
MTDLLFWQVYEKVVLAVSAVIPAKAGIQYFRAFLDSRLRGSDDWIAFFSNLLELTISFSPTCRARGIRMLSAVPLTLPLSPKLGGEGGVRGPTGRGLSVFALL